jgi:P4 family phage/plasmid primase-like protien
MVLLMTKVSPSEWLAQGLSVFPVNWRTKRPLVQWKPFQMTRPTEEQVKGWEKNLRPKAWAVALGRVSGNKYVVDVDSKDAEGSVVGKFLKTLGPTFTVETSPGKRHFYYVDPKADRLRNHAYRNTVHEDPSLPHVDVKGDGGYVLLPGSKHKDGGTYRVVDDSPVLEVSYEKVEFILRTLNKHWPVVVAVRPYFTKGGRNLTITGLSAWLFHHGFTVEEAGVLVNGLCYTVGEDGFIPEGLVTVKNTYDRAGEGVEVSFREFLSEELVDTLASLPNRFQFGSLKEEQEQRRIEAELGLDEPEERPPEAPAQVVAVEQQQMTYADAKYTDHGNALRFASRAGKQARFVPAWKKWIVWDGRRWRIDEQSVMVLRLAQKVAREIEKELTKPGMGGKEAKVAKKWAKASLGRGKIDAMIHLSKAFLSIDHTRLNQDGWLFNVENGTIDLRTGKLLPHNPEDFITNIAHVTYDPTAQCPTFLKFIGSSLPNEQIREFTRRFLGYSLTGDMREGKFRIDYGALGWNGKSSLYNILLKLTGDYGAKIDFGSLAEHQAGSPRNDLAGLQGKRLVVAIESAEDFELDVNTVKTITGRDVVRCRFLYAEFFDYQPTYKLWLATNHKPKVSDQVKSTWDRMSFVEWPKHFTREEQDRELDEKLTAELSGILNWAIDGCLDWQKEGLKEPDEVRYSTELYRVEEDPIADFVRDVLVENGDEKTLKELYAAYDTWRTFMGIVRPFGYRRFARLLEGRFPTRILDGYKRYAVGINERYILKE